MYFGKVTTENISEFLLAVLAKKVKTDDANIPLCHVMGTDPMYAMLINFLRCLTAWGHQEVTDKIFVSWSSSLPRVV